MPKPAAFAFDFKANSKVGSTKMDFADGVVTDIRQPRRPSPNPARFRCASSISRACSTLQRHHGVARGSNPNPCDRRMPIFDGKERFDLVLSYKGR